MWVEIFEPSRFVDVRYFSHLFLQTSPKYSSDVSDATDFSSSYTVSDEQNIGGLVLRSGISKNDKNWLIRLGKHVEGLIIKRGYPSVYDFWINKAGDELSRSTLNVIVAGKTDPRQLHLELWLIC
jgi:hypothetical protein